MWNKDEIEGKGKQIKGQVKAKLGEVFRNSDLEAKGEVERAEGKAQEGIGRARRRAEEMVEKVKDAVKKAHN